MSQVLIENPVINSPFAEPQRHLRFSDEGITNAHGEFGGWTLLEIRDPWDAKNAIYADFEKAKP